jgi:hypothetical protein
MIETIRPGHATCDLRAGRRRAVGCVIDRGARSGAIDDDRLFSCQRSAVWRKCWGCNLRAAQARRREKDCDENSTELDWGVFEGGHAKPSNMFFGDSMQAFSLQFY